MIQDITNFDEKLNNIVRELKESLKGIDPDYDDPDHDHLKSALLAWKKYSLQLEIISQLKQKNYFLSLALPVASPNQYEEVVEYYDRTIAYFENLLKEINSNSIEFEGIKNPLDKN